MDYDIKQLERIARELRFDVVDMIYQSKDGHPAPALSIADIITVLYFHEMNLDPKNPMNPERDRLILSKGHACTVIYAALAKRGFFSRDILPSLRSCGSILQGHPCMKKTPGIDMTSGSLGNGIAIGAGMDIARQRTGGKWHTFVITGDGELNEGVIWEGALAAARNKCENLIVFVDYNNLQSGGNTDEISGINPIAEKWAGFNWHVQKIDGNNIEQIITAIDTAKSVTGKPSVIIAKTTKGKGVSYMENNNDWHKAVPTTTQWETARRELVGVYENGL